MKISTEHLARCIETLERSLSLLDTAEAGTTEYEVFRNAVIKGFELTLEISAKLLRRALRPFLASPRAADALSYKDVLRHAAKHDLVSIEEVARWFEYRDNRNSTAHDYGEFFAVETLRLLPAFIEDAKAIRDELHHAEA
jgi:nucleotidyltransferase substrate binding protein (TIGR01987 family)